MKNKTTRILFTGIIVLLITAGLVGIALAQTDEKPEADESPYTEKIELDLVEQFNAGAADYIIRFKQQADLSAAYKMGWKERGEFVYNTLRQTAETSQAQAKGILGSTNLRFQTFIAGNELYVWGGNLDSAQSLAALPEVESIRATRVYHIDPVKTNSSLKDAAGSLTWAGDLLAYPYGPQQAVQAQASPQATTAWGITDTNADDFWSTFGVQGDGVVVANIDTGVQWNHPALVNQFKCSGNPSDPSCWSDPSNVCGGSACDNNGHGTHTMGTMVADDNPALLYTAGMAPNAQWIACKGCESTSCSDSALNTCADWILAPGGNPANRPNIVNNSWGGGGGDNWYQAKVQAWRAAGIFPAFSAGNSGSGCSTLGSPGDYQESFGSAAHNSSRLVASFSSRGPSSFGHDPYTKPNLSAPGVSICSTIPGSGWSCSYSGTSMASPHTAGAVALLWSCNPGLIGQIDQTFQILQDNVDAAPAGTCGAPPDGGGNYTYGYGYLNVLASGNQVCGATGTLQGTVSDDATSDPIPLAHIYTDPGPYEASTDDAGFYQITLMPGTYTVYAEAFGYLPASAVVDIEADLTTVQDFALEAASSSIVDGTVTDSLTGWPLYAWVAIAGYPGGGVWTDPVTGYYSVSLPDGSSYDFTVSAWVPGYLNEARTVGPLAGNRTENFALDADLDACTAPGYTTFPYGENFEANDGGFSFVGTGTWDWGSPTSGPGAAHSGSNVWATNLAGQYNNYENSYIESPDIDMSPLAGQSFDFSWWQWLQTESSYDYAQVQVSNDGGANWASVYGPISGGIDLGWTQHTANLSSAYAVSNFRVRFNFWTDGSVVYPGWYIDDLAVGTCIPPVDGGLSVGNVYDANFTSGLNGATVTNPVGFATTVPTPDDPNVEDGFYTLFAPAGTHPYTATIGGGYLPDYATVTVLANDTVQQDFFLDAGWLSSAAPTCFDVEVAEGYTLQDTLSLFNAGTAVASFEIKEKDQGMIPPLRLPKSDGNFPRGEAGPSIERAPSVSGEPTATAGAVYPLAGAPAFAMDIYPGYNLVNIPDVDVPGVWNIIQNIPGSQFFAGDFINGDFSTLWVIDYGTNMLKSVDTTTGAVTDIGPSTPYGGESWTGMTGSMDGVMYASSTNISRSTLYTVDLDTGAVTVVAQITNANCVIDIAITPDDDIYAVDICNDSLYSIDPATGAGTLIGSIGFDANYAQGMDYEEESGTLYLAAFNNSTFRGELRIADTSTGNSVLVGTFPGGAETDALAFATGGTSDVPWLSEDPVTGTIPADSTAEIAVTFDSMTYTVGTQLMAMLKVKSDDPYGSMIEIPVTMTVAAPGYGVDVGADQGLTGLPGETITYTVYVTNASNGPTDSFTMTLGASVYTSIVAPVTVGPLDPGQSAVAHIRVDVPPDAIPGDMDDVVVTATSQGDPTRSDSATLATTVGGSFAVSLDPDEAARSGAPGETVMYTLSVTNMGDITDTYVITATAGWDLQLPVTGLTLGPGESAPVMVHVDIPADAVGGDSDVTTVTVLSETIPSVTAESELTTTALIPTKFVYLPLVMDGFITP